MNRINFTPIRLHLTVLLYIMICVVSIRAVAKDRPNAGFQFQVRTTTTSVLIDVPGSEKLDRPSMEIWIQSGGESLWEGQMQMTRVENGYRFVAENLDPRLWSPTHPHLYQMSCVLSDGRRKVQESDFRIGFRYFETRDGQIFLNGKPIFLRGIAINPPGRGIPKAVETSRSFAEDYVAFMKSINVNIIRIPDDQTWYDVCDELGMMVFGGNYSGSVHGEKPPVNYDKAVDWYTDTRYAPIMHHPSLMIYAMTNEVPYTGEVAQKWIAFLSYAHKKLRTWDSTRLYIGNAGYGYGQSGDICDLHRYWGWYYASPFTFLNIRDYERITFPEKIQPLTFTECVGNYTGPDGRYNLTPNHKNPVSQLNWTGHAPARIQAELADQHQTFVFKQVTELIRRLRRINPESSGVFPFTIMFRNWHTVDKFLDMDPKPVTRQARISYQPVLLSWENWQSQGYAGSDISPVAHVINDSDNFSALTDVKLIVRLLDEAYTIHTSDTMQLPDVPYYDIHSRKVEVRLPAHLFEGNYHLEGILLSDGQEVSRNTSPIFVGRKDIRKAGGRETVKLYDPNGTTRAAFDANGLDYLLIKSFDKLKPSDCIVIGENSTEGLSKAKNDLADFVRQGGRAIILRQDSLHQAHVKNVLSVGIEFPAMDIDDPTYPPPNRPSRNGFNINPERPDHPVFAGINRAELRMWPDYTGWDETKPGFPAIYPVTDGFILSAKEDVENVAVLANYSVGLEGIALAEIFEGDGSILLCGFDLAKRAGIGPVADRLLRNMIRYMAGKATHENHVLVNAPIRWGDYESEKGILTGINSGLILNAKPALYGSYEGLPISLEKEGHMYAGAKWGWNNRAGKQYVPYGRRMFGPYFHRGFGGVPTPEDRDEPIGEGVFFCKVPDDTRTMTTVVWNPSNQELPIRININGEEVTSEPVSANQYEAIESRVSGNATDLKISLRGDRRLVILQTSFK